MYLMCANTFLINSSSNTESGLSNAVSHVFLRQNLTAVAQVEFLHPLSGRMGPSISQMLKRKNRICREKMFFVFSEKYIFRRK